MRKIALFALVSLLIPSVVQAKPLVIAHRGASGYLPDHTLESYQLAMEMGADFIEVDLVSSKDGRLLARHEPNIISTSDVAKHAAFHSRKTQKVVDGRSEEGYFAEDFTWEELKTIKAVQPLASRNQSFNGKFNIPLLEDVLQLIREYESKSGKRVGIYIETKHPTYFRAMDLALEERLIEILEVQKFTDTDRVFIQSFEVGNLKDVLHPLLKKKSLKIPLIQLIGGNGDRPFDYEKAGRKETYADLTTAAALKSSVGKYAAGIGPWKGTQGIEKLIENAHAAKLLVHPYTFRNETKSLAPSYQSPAEEYQAFFRFGVDGVFTDFSDTAVLQRNLFWLKNKDKK